jgi:peptide deformylase
MKPKPSNQHDWTERPLVLRLYPDRSLRKTCLPVTRFDSSLQDFAEDMHSLMQRYQGIGLAAPQVGILYRIIVAHVDKGPVFIVNPEIVEQSGSGVMTEGCLSLPGTHIDLQRALRIKIKGWDPRGKAVSLHPEGLLARVLQHEVDHLNGVLIIDHAEPLAAASKEEVAGSNEGKPLNECRA